MDKKSLLKISANPSNIEGIYNYCDYWCERCAFTSRCLNYQMEAKRKLESAIHSKDENEAFWADIQESFEMARELLREFSKDYGIEVPSKKETEFSSPKDIATEEKVRKHPLIIQGDQCIALSRQWMDEKEHLFSTVYNQEEKSIAIEPAPAFRHVDIKKVREAVEVILWYQFQISVKLMRALRSKELEQQQDLENSALQNDADGSAKVALIGLDRSIGAWNVLLSSFPEEEDRILRILICLDHLRKAAEKEFPHARSFKRPGFDTV